MGSSVTTLSGLPHVRCGSCAQVLAVPLPEGGGVRNMEVAEIHSIYIMGTNDYIGEQRGAIGD